MTDKKRVKAIKKWLIEKELTQIKNSGKNRIGETKMNKELRNKLRAFIDETGKSASAVAKGIGRSPAALSQYLNFSYKGDVAKLEVAIENWLARQAERQERNVKPQTDFIQTSIARKVFELADYCLIENEIVRPHFALPYNAQTKPIERDFLKFKTWFSKRFPGCSDRQQQYGPGCYPAQTNRRA